MCLVHEQPIHAQLLKSHHIILAALGLELVQPRLHGVAGPFQLLDRETLAATGLYPVAYTHLDVYKRQALRYAT